MKSLLIALMLVVAWPVHAEQLRVATFNASLTRRDAGDLMAAIQSREAQVTAVAEIIQRVDPDILLLNEFDHDPRALAAFQSLLRDGQNTIGDGAAQGIDFPYSFTAPSNTGLPSGYDLNGNQEIGGPGDAYGFGFFPGQYGMAVLSKHPIAETRTFQGFLWKDMPDNLMPKGFYSDGAESVLRLSSKSHWDITLTVGGIDLHLLASHPTPPVFDGPEDRNGRRNFDEIRFWADYVRGSDYFYDDKGQKGGLQGAHFVIAGDLNADPQDGDSVEGAVAQLLSHPRITPTAPSSMGGVDASFRQTGANATHRGDPALDTADFGFDPDNPGKDRAPGNLRVDYVLPSKSLNVIGSGIYWPKSSDPLFKLAEYPTSDHRLIWIDIDLPE